jgi:hypothetical protein
MSLTPTLEQLHKFCALINLRNEHLHPFLFQGYLYATDGRICIRIKDDGSLKIDIAHNGIDYAKIFEGEENCDLLIPPLPARIDCKRCNGTGIEHDCPDCEGEGTLDAERRGGIECQKCAGKGTITPAADAPPCWWCNGRGEQEQNPVAIGDTHINRIYLDMAAEMPGARIVRIAGTSVARIKFNGGEIAIMPTRVRPE